MTTVNIDTGGWHPVAASDDLPFRHVYQGELWGQELALWRADDGFVNVWENRCLHRGVRLSIGANLGSELRCQYHGWRYANRSAGCTYIPAHPADAPARTICHNKYPSRQRYGLVWSTLDERPPEPNFAVLDDDAPIVLRGIAVNAPPQQVLEALHGYQFPNLGSGVGESEASGVASLNAYALSIQAKDGSGVVFFVQPVDAGRSIIRGLVARITSGASAGASMNDRGLAIQRAHDAKLCALRDRIEANTSVSPTSLRSDPTPAANVSLEPVSNSGRHAPLRVTVVEKRNVAADVVSFTLESLNDALPVAQPGAHVDVHLPNGLIRQYSITNGPTNTQTYVIGVKLEPDSRGGSQCLHSTVSTGDVLALSAPINNFPLRQDALHTVLVAGGIGITPILAMARTLREAGISYELHHFARDAELAAFTGEVAALGDSATVHLGLDDAATGTRIAAALGNYAEHQHAYVCGPGPMISATLEAAATRGWPAETVHYEHFKNDQIVDSTSGFEIALARSGLTLDVPPGKSIIEVLRDNGVGVLTSCEQGACGTCKIAVLDGEPLHQDVYLTNAERDSGKTIMACVSRARSDRLVLDL
jgi:ferredoxin-NADP reductase/nitrite reductase/ring-hydroxylating ferredoxin subunit